MRSRASRFILNRLWHSTSGFYRRYRECVNLKRRLLTEEEGALLVKGHEGEVSGQAKKEKKNWTSHVNIRGYVQTRNTTMLGGDDGIKLILRPFSW